MRTKIKSLLSISLLMALSGMASADPAVNLVGSWTCNSDAEPSFLATFNLGGTFTASSTLDLISVNHGVWQRTGLNTFASTDYAYQINHPGGEADLIIKTNAVTTATDENHISASFDIYYYNLDGSPAGSETGSATCTRILVE